MATIGFHQLPDELLVMIFNHLDFSDLRKSRLVSKRFKYVIDESVRWNELIFTTKYHKFTDKEWFNTKRSIDSNRIIIKANFKNSEMTSFIFEKNLIGLKLLNNIKRMRVMAYDHDLDYDSIMIYSDNLSKFNQLEQFEFFAVSFERDVIINNQNLKILDIYSDLYSLKLNTPKLQTISLFSCDYLKSIEFSDPLTIEHLKIQLLITFEQFRNHFRPLSNLKTFEVSRNFQVFKFSEILFVYPKLVNLILSEPFYYEYEPIKSELIDLLRKKKEFELKAQIQLDNQMLDSIEQLNEIINRLKNAD